MMRTLVVSMKLIEPNLAHFDVMASWITSPQLLEQWAGPNSTYPITADRLMSDFDLPNVLSYSMINKAAELLAFGQCYERLGCCHLSRLIVAPEHRGNALIADLIEQLSVIACQTFDLHRCSLFVFQTNSVAISAYEKNGFKITTYPLDMPVKACFYMTKEMGFE